MAAPTARVLPRHGLHASGSLRPAKQRCHVELGIRNACSTCVAPKAPTPLSSLQQFNSGPRHVRRLYTQSLSASPVERHCVRPFDKPRTMATQQSSPSTRRKSTRSRADEPYEAVVVGAGPAGITAVGNLLEARIDRILWVDEAFDGGRVNKYYREVPSNTKVKLFVDYATAVTPFRKVISNLPSRDRWEEPSASDGVPVGGKEDKLQDLRALDQEKGCDLAHAADMCLILTQGLKKTPGVTTAQGRVSSAGFDEQSSLWNLALDPSQTAANAPTSATTKRVIFCTGASPTDPPLPNEPTNLQHLHLDDALAPSKLHTLLPSSSSPKTIIAVIGASHSAVLVLRNLATLALTSHPNLHIKWFTRHPLRYAEYHDAFIARDNTGLKGEAAVWAQQNLESDTLPCSPVSRVLSKISYQKGDEQNVYEAQLYPDCAYVVQAIGYTGDPLPSLSLRGSEVTPVFDHDRGVFTYDNGQVLPGVYGAGIAFPQRVVDPKYGHEEFNVGFFKFMKAVRKWVGEWKESRAAVASSS